MSVLATNNQVSFEKKLETNLDTLVETDEHIVSEETSDDISTISEVLSVNPHVYGVKDIRDALTLENLQNALYELGIIQLNWPEIEETEFEGRTDFPRSYITNSKKEKLLLAYAENFRQQFAYLYPESKPLLLQAPNECGLQKMVCTTIRPTKLCFAGMDTWEGCASLVADFFDYECLRKPVLLYSDDFNPAHTRDSETPSPPPAKKRKKPYPLSDAIKAIQSFSSQKESHDFKSSQSRDCVSVSPSPPPATISTRKIQCPSSNAIKVDETPSSRKQSHNSTSTRTRDTVSPSPPHTTPSQRKKPCPSLDSIKVIKSLSPPRANPPSNRSAPEEDEFDTFGRNVGQQLRSMPLEDALETQVLLQSVLTKQRIKSLQAQRDALFVNHSPTRDSLYEGRVLSKESQSHMSTALKIEYSDSEEQ